MKAVILAGGFGTRISEESQFKPKPMVEIGGKPILWHLMKIYSSFDINEFVICCGYKGYIIKEFFANYFLHTSDITINMKNNNMKVHKKNGEPWTVTLVDTGEKSMTGGRLKRVEEFLGDDSFCFTYGDGLTDLNISEVVKYHKSHGKEATLTAVRPPGRFGELKLNAKDLFDGSVTGFNEKPLGDGRWINGGFFVLNKEIFKRIDNDQTVWENEPLQSLAIDGQLKAYCHEGFWQPMDTLKEKNLLEDLWITGKAPWRTWE